ncbi:MAG: hypothetical protein F4X93_02310 [Proteobacteria bacterium]|nr:hypothetical protein [Pseudomonadota bacterium]
MQIPNFKVNYREVIRLFCIGTVSFLFLTPHLAHAAPPAITSAVTDEAGTTITITYDQDLDESSVPSTEGFIILKSFDTRPSHIPSTSWTGAGFYCWVGNQGISSINCPVAITSVTVSGADVTLIIPTTHRILAGDAIALQYSASHAVNPIQIEAVGENLPEQAANIVGNNRRNITNNVPEPQIQSAIATGTRLVLTYDTALDSTQVPPNSSYRITVGGVEVSGNNDDAPWEIAVSGRQVIIIMGEPIPVDQETTLKYTQPTLDAQRLQSSIGNDAPGFENYEVTVRQPHSRTPADITPPELVSVVLLDDVLTLAFSESLRTDTPPVSAFGVLLEGQSVDVVSIEIQGATVTLHLVQPARIGEAVTVSYTVPDTNPIRDEAGNPATPFETEIDNTTPDREPLELQSAMVNGVDLDLAYDDMLDASATPAPTDYTVRVNGKAVAVQDVTLGATTVSLTLAMAVIRTDRVTLSYGARTLRGVDGNPVDTYTDYLVTNNSTDHPASLWLSRFGRTVATQVTDSVQARIFTPDERTGLRYASYTGETDTGTQAAFWGRLAGTGFNGEQDDVNLSGDITSYLAGVELRNAMGTLGITLGQSDGEGNCGMTGRSDEISAQLTGIYPYLGYRLTPALTAWGTAGYASGHMRLDDVRADIELQMIATGLRSTLAHAGPLHLTAEIDALYARTKAHRPLPATERVHRLRAGLEGTLRAKVYHHLWVPALRASVRYDGGDAETGTGLELHPSLTYRNLANELSAELRGHHLANHGDDDFEENGYSLTLAWSTSTGTEVSMRLEESHVQMQASVAW